MIDVAVLGGGRSAEHDVSLQSAVAVVRALDRTRWRPWQVFIDREGRWHASTQPLRDHQRDVEFDAELASPRHAGAALAELIDRGVCVIFPALHGSAGEDGTLQGMLELHDLAFVGSGTAASAVGMDKIRTRECLTNHGVPMAPAMIGTFASGALDDELAKLDRKLGYPCFLKTDCSGSSFGVARCESVEDARRFLLHRSGRRYVAERALIGEEISVPVLGNSGCGVRSLPPIGIYPRAATWFTSTSKYAPGGSDEVVPPRGLDAATITSVQALAALCHEALGCDGASRTDMIVTRDGPFVLEVNTLPGLTEASLLPKCAAAAGISFAALLDELLRLAFERRSSAFAERQARES